ncbi:MAG: ATP-binding cassette domain-containing protein [Rhizobiales bacterium]|nr:ATP-binding cassette domain-containing protein [Rhizobacter sp.]
MLRNRLPADPTDPGLTALLTNDVTARSSRPEPVLELQGLRHRYGDRDTFARLDLALEPGAICCLLGPSGCGKTTVLRCIAGFERVAEGRIRIDDVVVSGAAVHLAPERRRVGMVFQDYALFPHLNALRNVAFGVRDAATAAQRATQLLETVGLGGASARANATRCCWPPESSCG